MPALTPAEIASVAETVRTLIEGKSPGPFCATLGLVPGDFDGEGPEGCVIVVHAAGAAVGNELLRIDDRLYHAFPARIEFVALLDNAIGPLVEGGRPIVVCDQRYDGIVILSPERVDDPGRHGGPHHELARA